MKTWEHLVLKSLPKSKSSTSVCKSPRAHNCKSKPSYSSMHAFNCGLKIFLKVGPSCFATAQENINCLFEGFQAHHVHIPASESGKWHSREINQ